jgi:transcriptional regulator with XRE-family HTH domain
MLLETSHALNIGDKVETVFAEAAVALGEITWTGVKLFGCQFDHSVAAELLEQAVSRVLRQEQAENASMSQTVDTFGARLQRLRMAKGLHQVDIAERLGVTAVAISNWESDRSQPRQHRIAELAKILGVPSQQLATNAVVLPETLPEVLASSKAQVANLLGVTPASVKIIVDL